MNVKMNIVDFHAHILPGADHGSTSLETSLKQLKIAKKCGVDRIIATSHFYPHIHSAALFLEKRSAAYEKLRPHLQGLPDVRVGAEVLICNGIESLPRLDEFFVHKTNTLLLELPNNEFSQSYRRSVQSLVKSGVDVVLAHVERYPKENIETLIDVGAKLQVNAKALISTFRKKYIIDWLKEGYVVAIGSDIHGESQSAYSDFRKAVLKNASLLDNVREFSNHVFIESKIL